ncbi:hypothetical protein MJ579_20830 [Klebsiella pneumoniae]|nr:hypothetical protein MJ579_20830 [Klebsiella pneumoniae]
MLKSAECAGAGLCARVTMINGDDGKKLSKRHGAVGVMQYRDDGYCRKRFSTIWCLGWSRMAIRRFSLAKR